MKHISVFLVVLLNFLLFSVNAFAAGTTIENGNFESESKMWSAGAFSEDAPHSGLRSLKLTTPEENINGTYQHTVTYLLKLNLTGSTVYTLSFFVRSSSSILKSDSPSCAVSMPPDSSEIIFHISDITQSWNKISVRFMVDVKEQYTLSLNFENDFQESEIYLDEIDLSPIHFSPTSLAIIGPRSVTIPAKGSNSYSYQPAVIDKECKHVTIQNAVIYPITLPDGVVFDEKNYSIFLDENVQSGTQAILECRYLGNSTHLLSKTFTISFSDNMFKNGSFSDLPLFENWNSEFDDCMVKQENDNSYLQINAVSSGEHYTSEISTKQSFFLYSSSLYVFRAKLRTDAGFESKNMWAEAFVDADNKINVSISDIGGEVWNSVFASFTVPADGIYTMHFNVSTNYKTPIYIDEMNLQNEEICPSGLYFNPPTHVNIPETKETRLPISYVVFDQVGAPCTETASFSVYPENCGVYVVENDLIVHSEAKEQKYFVIGKLETNSLINQTRVIEVSKKSIGDGSFETTAPNSMWETAAPSNLQFLSTANGLYPSDGNKLARLTMNGPVSALLSDSVYRYDNNGSFVFEGDMQMMVPDIETVVTVLVDNAASESFDDNLVIGQFTLSSASQHIQKLFTPSESVTGRLLIAFNTPETHNQQIIILDNISVAPAKVIAESASISGVPDVNKNIIGRYRFSSNFGAFDSSTFRWLVSDSRDGIYMPLEGKTENTLSITADLVGKYVKFEITPASMQGPVIGESIVSAAVCVGAVLQSGHQIERIESEDIPSKPDEKPDVVEKPVLLRGSMRIVDLNRFKVYDKHKFLDLNEHWAKDEIEILSAAGVIQGRGNGLFEPDALITRAEFSAFMARAFELAPIYYEGPYQDVKPYNWYAGAVAVVTKYEIAHGTSEATFSPELPITREEMTAMIMRAFKKTSAQSGVHYQIFTDEKEMSSWAKHDIKDASALQLIVGFPDGKFNPKLNTTRAEAAVTIKRMLSVLAQIV